MLPSAEVLHLRRLRRNLFDVLSEQDLEGNRNPQGGAAEAEERVAAGRMKSSEAVPEQKRDTERQTLFRAKSLQAHWLQKTTAITARFELACPRQEGYSSPPALHLGRFLFARSNMRRKTWSRPAGLAAEMGIVKSPGFSKHP